jgi:hypothetical protein
VPKSSLSRVNKAGIGFGTDLAKEVVESWLFRLEDIGVTVRSSTRIGSIR